MFRFLTYSLLLISVFFLGNANAQAVKDQKVLIVHSQLGTPYDAFTAPLLKRLKEVKPSVIIKEIVLNNHEKRINRHLSNPEYTKFDVAIAVGTIAARALRDQKILKANFPVVFGGVTDPIGESLIDHFNVPPSGRFTGVSYSIDIRDRIRDLRRVFPKAQKIGVIYSTMPQSVSYKRWLTAIQAEKEFKDIEFIYRRVGMVKDKVGPKNMVHAAGRHIKDIAPMVDVYISPSDQMGVLPEFAQSIVELTNKPVFGIGKKDVDAPMAAVASSYPRIEESGVEAANMVLGLLNGKSVSDFPPMRPQYDLILNNATATHFHIDRKTLPPTTH